MVGVHVSPAPLNNGADHGTVWSVSRSVWVLLASAVAIGVMSELLVSSVEHVGEAAGMSEVFIGVVLVAIIGNAAEHSTAVVVALKNKMDLSINIAVGSSLQIALFVAPMLVFLSYFIGPQPMDLLFTTMEVVAIAASVGIMAVISQVWRNALDGRRTASRRVRNPGRGVFLRPCVTEQVARYPATSS